MLSTMLITTLMFTRYLEDGALDQIQDAKSFCSGQMLTMMEVLNERKLPKEILIKDCMIDLLANELVESKRSK